MSSRHVLERFKKMFEKMSDKELLQEFRPLFVDGFKPKLDDLRSDDPGHQQKWHIRLQCVEVADQITFQRGPLGSS